MAKPHASRLTPHASRLTPHASPLNPNVSRLTPRPKPKPNPNPNPDPNPITLSPNPNPNLSPRLAQEQDCELSTVALAHVYPETLQPYCNPTATLLQPDSPSRRPITPHPSHLTPLTLTPLTRILTP